ncbi:MAG: hypothetical protein LIO51_04665 [Clostridiales bacterium]|nr:hypothetical protein [Clostridiales bacterium]
MAGRKSGRQKGELLPWLSAKPDNIDRRFLQVGNSVMLSKTLQSLSAGARWLYFALSMEAAGKREVLFTHSSAQKYGIPGSSFDRQILELKWAGFVESVPDENQAQYSPNRFKFCYSWKGVDKTPLKIIRKELPPE